MKVIELAKLPDKKRTAICVYDTNDGENPARYVIGYIDHNEEMFQQALVDSKYINYVSKQED